MFPRQKLVGALLVSSLTLVPELVWAGAHALEHRGDHGFAAGGHRPADLADMAANLVHGHEHPEGTPEHQHHLFPAPVRAASQGSFKIAGSVPAPPATSRAPSPLRIAAVRPSQRIARAGPPLLHALCVLLI